MLIFNKKWDFNFSIFLERYACSKHDLSIIILFTTFKNKSKTKSVVLAALEVLFIYLTSSGQTDKSPNKGK